jgi:hypothetical protein
MSLIALLVEGKTERIFFQRLLPYIQLPNVLFVSTNLVEILGNTIHTNKIWLQDCGGDAAIPSFIAKNRGALIRNNFESLILVRDYFPENRPPTSLCKRDVCRSILGNIPSDIRGKYSNNIFINLSVEEIEAWFFADRCLFQRLESKLTESYINSRYDDILTINPELIRHPSTKLKEIIRHEIPGLRYRKTESEIHAIVSRVDIPTCLNMMNGSFIQSFFRFVNFLLGIL